MWRLLTNRQTNKHSNPTKSYTIVKFNSPKIPSFNYFLQKPIIHLNNKVSIRIKGDLYGIISRFYLLVSFSSEIFRQFLLFAIEQLNNFTWKHKTHSSLVIEICSKFIYYYYYIFIVRLFVAIIIL